MGNNYGGDLSNWYETEILSYLNAGGNVFLMTRMGQDFVYDALRSYLGFEWAEAMENTTRKATAVHAGLVDMPRINTQSYNAVFDTTLINDESTVLFVQDNIWPVARGLGVWRNPAGGGTQRSDGARFAFISGRPYRYDLVALRSNVDYILRNLLLEPYSPTAVEEDGIVLRGRLGLSQNFPNPFNPKTTIGFSLPSALDVDLSVFDVQGRRVATLVEGRCDAGEHLATWNGMDDRGHRAASGVYWYRLSVGEKVLARKMVLLK